ncbi:MAG: thymidylate synthase (FAD) [Treponema sp.]|nr:MAG: thymidylate synthase (FAD) [Treponema sp.]
MAHCLVPTAEEILDKEFKVLDHGFVRLVDYLGGDARIVQAARVSYGDGTKTSREDAGLIDYLLRNKHTSPFEQVVMTFHLKMPIFVARQWLRHRTARLNEISGRYSIMKNEAYLPSNEDLAFQSTDNKQGREATAIPDELLSKTLDNIKATQKYAFENYNQLLDDNIAREIARINLPLSIYTEMYWQIDLHNLFHFMKLRCDAHAQKEIRDYAFTLLDICRKVAPMATKSFENHILNGVNFSEKELDAIENMIAGKNPTLTEKEELRLKAKLNERRQK